MKRYHLSVLAVLLVLLSACNSTNVAKDKKAKNPLFDSATAYTDVNLHPYQDRNRLTTINYLLPGFIPRCTKVTFNKITPEVAVFTVEDSGKQYNYFLSGHTKMALRDHLKKVFAPSCKKASEISSLNEKDREGIKTADVKKGMTKQGVLYAVGYPPDHRTPSTDANQWTYWNNRFDQFLVVFNDEGKVVQIQE